MNKKKSDFDKVFSAWDILVIAFGAMIGWGWVVSTGGWIEKGGVVGAALGFAIGGVMIFFVGLTYAELTAAMHSVEGNMSSVTGQWVRLVHSCAHGRSFLDMSVLHVLKHVHFQRSLHICGLDS